MIQTDAHSITTMPAKNALPPVSVTFNVVDAVDELRQLLARADAIAHASENLFEQVIWVEDGDDRRRLERLAHLVGAAAEATQAAVESGDDLAARLSARMPGA
jgi:hypothetical protein